GRRHRVRRRRAQLGGHMSLVRKLVALIMVPAMLTPSLAWAETPYSVHWVITEDAESCAKPVLGHDGGAYFSVNDAPLPTYQVLDTPASNPDGSKTNTMEAPFDSVLLHIGANEIFFGIETERGGDLCTHEHDVVHLISVPL